MLSFGHPMCPDDSVSVYALTLGFSAKTLSYGLFLVKYAVIQQQQQKVWTRLDRRVAVLFLYGYQGCSVEKKAETLGDQALSLGILIPSLVFNL